MEFYNNATRQQISTVREFQFPTGWNSTKDLHVTARKPPLCFNSQRDGILQFALIADFICTTVSIPNGMEFYSSTHYGRITICSFNSQRDGILPFLVLSFCILSLFQFPTGWNSTQTVHRFCRLLARFNSQRDGILHRPPMRQERG